MILKYLYTNMVFTELMVDIDFAKNNNYFIINNHIDKLGSGFKEIVVYFKS